MLQNEVKEKVEKELIEFYGKERVKTRCEQDIEKFKIFEILLEYYFEKELLQNNGIEIREFLDRYIELSKKYIPETMGVIEVFSNLYKETEITPEIGDVKTNKKGLLELTQRTLQEKK